MSLSKQEFTSFIRDFDFRNLFNEMGWNNDRSSQPVNIDGHIYTLKAIAEKSGFKILHCSTTPDGRIPDYSTRKKIELDTAKLFHEHLIIYSDARKQEQIWQYVVRHPGKPTKVTETRYHISQKPELLFNRASGIFFKMEDEENITIVDVTRKMADNFLQNNERVTKQFYDRFKKEHTTFLSFIQGIEIKVHKDWYASLMLNRLMFCYFIQKKGFLDHNPSYLRDKLNTCREKKGKDKFYSFYRNFLLVLFHKGLNDAVHSKELIFEIGNIPFLNGGLFDEHELEKMYIIDVEDNAFERIFDFFDEYNWYLDDRPNATGKDINPDVIGYIFEKYINDRAEMGAYYTKQDITDYISKNCIVPFLFDEVKRNYPKPFSSDGEIWQMVKNSGDNYIYDAVKYGINTENLWGDLPEDIIAGFNPELQQIQFNEVQAREDLHLWQIRQNWNHTAPPEAGLPTEIWREVIDRRKRYTDIRKKIASGEICEINDFITYNLNIRQFVQDAVENTNDTLFIQHFYKALTQISILDPTCGSGAFLFAAMNILEPLYEACILRMENFVAEAPKGHNSFFEETLSQIQSPGHPNRQYFIYKSIILNNLYGVDLMKEAVEIAKLRLFLKLVATVDPDYRKANLGLEPLPDIDFNIRAGNTLVGFATENELGKCLVEDMMGAIVKNEIEEKCDIVSRAFTHYKEIQLDDVDDYKEFKKSKEELNKRLKELNHELNLLLHKQASAIKYDIWLQTHQPFHWFAEFYEIIHDKGGFDVVIGNPPYVEHTALKDYKVIDYITTSCGNLFANIAERGFQIIKKVGKFGFIVPISLTCSKRMNPLQKMLLSRGTYFSDWSWRPSKLFEGADKANLSLSIFIVTNNNENFSSTYIRWNAESRYYIFEKLGYVAMDDISLSNIIPKIGTDLEKNLLLKLLRNRNLSAYISNQTTSYKLFYRRTGGLYWKVFTDFRPVVFLNDFKTFSSKEESLDFISENYLYASISLLWSDLYWWWYQINSDVRNNNPSDLKSVPVTVSIFNDKKIFSLSKSLIEDLKANSIWDERKYKGNVSRFQKFFPKHSKHIINEIDTVIAEHFSFTEEELDFIVNYDIKYRMGNELDNEENE